MYINQIQIRNFRNFKSLRLSLRPGSNCLIGENNSGKTNLLVALRLAIDINLPAWQRNLNEQDFSSPIDMKTPQQILIAVDFADFKDKPNQEALVGKFRIGTEADKARIYYRFAPSRKIRDQLGDSGEIPAQLGLDDYDWEITGGGPEMDLDKVKWNDPLGKTFNFQAFRNFEPTFLSAVRDVDDEIRKTHNSPLGRLLASAEFSAKEKDALVSILKVANEQIEKQDPIKRTGEVIDTAYNNAAGATHPLQVRLGLSEPTFPAISRSLKLVLSSPALKNFPPGRNGLGLNNILYISMLLEFFIRQSEKETSSGQLIMLEEPEAHIHPMLQRTFFDVLAKKEIQTILSTHSTHITSRAPLETYCVLVQEPTGTSGCNLADVKALDASAKRDIPRFLDATRSTLLYARKVILVEGPAELFLIPALINQVLGIDLEAIGIAVIPIHGVHFATYAKLFGPDALRKKCAIVTDGDLPSDATGQEGDGDVSKPQLAGIENSYVKVFVSITTLEKEISLQSLLPCIEKTAKLHGGRKTAGMIRAIAGRAATKAELNAIGDAFLGLAYRVGKARLAQTLSENLDGATELPKYISDAVAWLKE